MTRATGMAVAAPLVVFGLLYVLLVQPARGAAAEALGRLETARTELTRRRSLATPQASAAEESPLATFDARMATADPVGAVGAAMAAALNGPAVGGVSNLTMATGATGYDPIDSMLGSFPRKVAHTPVTATFDARYEQIVQLFSSLRALPAIVDLRSVQLAPVAGLPAGPMRTTVSLLVFHRPEAPTPPLR